MEDKAGAMLFIAESIGQAMVNYYGTANQWGLSVACAGGNNDNEGCHDLLRYRSEKTKGQEVFDRAPQYFAFPLWSRFGPEGTQMLVAYSERSPELALSLYAGRWGTAYSLLAINKTANTISAAVTFRSIAPPGLPDSVPSIVSATADIAAAFAPAGSSLNLDTDKIKFNGIVHDDLRPTPSLRNDLSNAPPLTNVTVNPSAPAGMPAVFYNFPPYSATLLRMQGRT